MERENTTYDSSTFSVPGTMQDLTLSSTPLPQASSTATKKRSSLTKEGSDCRDPFENCNKMNLEQRESLSQNLPEHSGRQSSAHLNNKEKETKRTSLLDSACKNINEMQEKVKEELAKVKATKERAKGSQNITSSLPVPQNISTWLSTCSVKNSDEDVIQFLEEKGADTSSQVDCLKNSKNVSVTYQTDEKSKLGNKESCNNDFEFRVPAPRNSKQGGKGWKRSEGKYLGLVKADAYGFFPLRRCQSYMSENKGEKDASRVGLPSPCSDSSESVRVSSSGVLSERKQSEDDGVSICSSANSSLGILPPEVLEDVQNQSLSDFSQREKLDLSQRLAQQLSLDTSHIQDSALDISELATARMKKVLAARSEENKENEASQQRKSSDYFHIHGYSSDNSKNNTAQEVARLSTFSGSEFPKKDTSFNKKPLTEQNSFASNHPISYKENSNSARLSIQSTASKQSFASNPFVDMSKVSVSSEEFQTGEDVVERLRTDEEAWHNEFGLGNKRSLSGIYGDGDISISTKGEKLSISSFLRSGSGPLGCLEKAGEKDRPTFGLQVTSPEKKSKPRPLLPPPTKDKLTFGLNEIPTKPEPTPWTVDSLIEQYSVVHGVDNDSDVSVPSLSCINDMLDKMRDSLTPTEVLDKLIAMSRKKKPEPPLDDNVLSHCTKQNTLKTIPSSVEGENSFCRGYESVRNSTASTRYSSSFNSHLSLDEAPHTTQPKDNQSQSVVVIDDSVASSVCNVTDFDSGDEEYVCVMVPESMDFDIFNKLRTTQYYSINKACYVKGRRQDSAALVHVPITKVSLPPGQMCTISVTVAALVAETIKIKLDVVRSDPLTDEIETNTVFGKLVAEIPKISLVTPGNVEMKPVIDPEFHGEYREKIELKNNGCSVVPIKLALTRANYDDIFYFDKEKKSTTITFTLGPGQTIKQTVYCLVPPIFETDKKITGVIPGWAEVETYLSTTAKINLAPLSSVRFSAHLKPNFFFAPPFLVVPSDIAAPLRLYNNLDEPVEIQANLTPGFSFHVKNGDASTKFVIPPHKSFSLLVHLSTGKSERDMYNNVRMGLKSKMTGDTVDAIGDLKLHSYSPKGEYTVKLRATYVSSSTVSQWFSSRRKEWQYRLLRALCRCYAEASSCIPLLESVHLRDGLTEMLLFGIKITPQSSRAVSPTLSPSPSIEPERELLLTCTHKELVWGGCALQQRAVKVCCLKNQGLYREKLCLKITDQQNCFKILSEKNNLLETEVKLSLHPMENRQISVVILPGSTGPKWGHLTISRINSPLDKNVLPLYAFGGKAKVNIEGVLQDHEQRMWLYLDCDSLSSEFTLSNVGDNSAFIKISEGMTATAVGGGLSIAPPEHILRPAHSVTVQIMLSVTPERLEYLLSHPSQTAICITRLTVIHGDESTRLRLSRLSRLNRSLSTKLSQLNQLLPAENIPDLDKLGDPTSCAETLWAEDVSEWTLGVLVKRSALEALRLDTSVEFIDLDTTVCKQKNILDGSLQK